jgi:hypothetical protein
MLAMPALRTLPPAPIAPSGTVATSDATRPGGNAPSAITTVLPSSQVGTRAARPAAGSVPHGYLYYASDVNGLYESDGVGTWTTVGSRGVYNPLDYGAKNDGVTDDSAAWQAAVNAMGATGCGTLVYTGTSLLANCITLPARGTYLFEGVGQAASPYDLDDPWPGRGRAAIVCPSSGTIGNQPTPYGNSGNILFLFDSTPATAHNGGGELSLEFRNFAVSLGTAFLPNPVALLAVSNHVRMLKMSDIGFFNVGMGYLGTTINDGVQTQEWVISHCDDCLATWLWGDGKSPYIGVIGNCQTTLAGDNLLPANFPGQFLSQNTYSTWFIHDNLFQGTQASIANPRAVLHFSNISQACLGSIHDNAFFHADGGCIYWQDNFTYNVGQTGLGTTIHHNQFQDWNEAQRGGLGQAAIYVDHSTGSPPDQLLTIDENHFQGNAGGGTPTTNYGILTVDDPAAANISIAGVTDPGSPGIFRAMVGAPFRLNGIDYGVGGAGAVQIGFDGKNSYSITTTIAKTDRIVEGTGGAGGITLTMPTLMSGQGGTRIRVSKVDAGVGAVTVTGIAGANTSLAAQWASHDYEWDGTRWLP